MSKEKQGLDGTRVEQPTKESASSTRQLNTCKPSKLDRFVYTDYILLALYKGMAGHFFFFFVVTAHVTTVDNRHQCLFS